MHAKSLDDREPCCETCHGTGGKGHWFAEPPSSRSVLGASSSQKMLETGLFHVRLIPSSCMWQSGLLSCKFVQVEVFSGKRQCVQVAVLGFPGQREKSRAGDIIPKRLPLPVFHFCPNPGPQEQAALFGSCQPA